MHAFAVLATLLCSAVTFIQSPADVFGPVRLHEPTPSSARDFGAVVSHAPSAILRPESPADIALLLATLSSSSSSSATGPRASVAARGTGHSLQGQAQARGGIVVETRSLPRAVSVRGGGRSKRVLRGRGRRRDVGGGTGGVPQDRAGAAVLDGLPVPHRGRDGVQCRHQRPGVQARAADQQRPATGSRHSSVSLAGENGEVVTCSPTRSSDLFFAVLGGLGQFGIITRARILLQHAPPKVRWVRAFYDSFDTFASDQELLVSMPEQVDYVEGFMVLNEHSIPSSSIAFPAHINFSPDFGSKGNKKVYYCIEFKVHDFQQDGSNSVDHVVELVSGELSYMRAHMYSVEVSYFDFLNRVRMEEESLRSRGLWDVPLRRAELHEGPHVQCGGVLL